MGTSRRRVLAAAVGLVAARVLLGPASARAQEAPPNPGDDELDAGRAGVAQAEAEIADLRAQVSAATAAVDAAQGELGASLAAVAAAEATRDAARAVADAAQDAVAATREGQRVADALAEDARGALDDFVAASYRQGSTAGSVSGFAGVTDPDDVLDRAELLAALGESQRDALDALGRAQVGKANQDARARAALEDAQAREEEAERAGAAAVTAYESAVAATAAAEQRSAELLATQSDVVLRLDVAERTLASLEGQRRTYAEFVRARDAEQARARRAAAEAAAARAARAVAARRAAERAPRARGSDSPAPAPPEVAPVEQAPPSSSGTVAPTVGELTSGFGARGGSVHYGIDLANSIGTPIVSVQAGTVISAGPASGFGLWVRVRHDDGTITVYGHNNTNVVSVGQRVGVGQQIATIGNRGQSTGPHVHFEVAPGGGAKVDPLVWLRSRGVSV